MRKGEAYGPIASRPGKSGEKYVSLQKKDGIFAVWIPIHGERRASGHPHQRMIGRFQTLEEAVQARDKYLDAIE